MTRTMKITKHDILKKQEQADTIREEIHELMASRRIMQTQYQREYREKKQALHELEEEIIGDIKQYMSYMSK